LAIALGILGAIALGAAVVGFLWLVQFVVGNEERRSRESE
jgi:hypothetical protein